MAWKVPRRMPLTPDPSPAGRGESGLEAEKSRSTRERISREALLVKVTAITPQGGTARSVMSQAMRWGRTRVLPLPGPARTRTGPSGAVTARCWAGLRPSRIEDKGLLREIVSVRGIVAQDAQIFESCPHKNGSKRGKKCPFLGHFEAFSG